MSLPALRKQLKALGSPARAAGALRFFKTGKGEYGEWDKFRGISVPVQRQLVKQCLLTLGECRQLLHSPWHEDRSVALMSLCALYKKGCRDGVALVYLTNTRYVNNWDLVDMSAPVILGDWCEAQQNWGLLQHLARSDKLWERRIGMVATLASLRKKNPRPTQQIARILYHDSHDLMQKAVGWMLREMGKHCGRSVLTDFLHRYGGKLGRTALRYSIEHYSKAERRRWMNLG